MKNDALLTTGGVFNPFTAALHAALMKNANSAVLVKMRNGDWCEVKHLDKWKEGHPCDHPDQVPVGGFISSDGRRYWYADGHSMTSHDFDLIEHRFDEQKENQ